MLQYSSETSHQAIDFLTKNGLISITQKNELKKLGKEHKMNELNVMLKFFPENEDKIPLVLSKIFNVSDEGYFQKETDQLYKLGGFILVKRVDEESKILAYDPQQVIDYFNYLTPNVLILSREDYAQYDKNLPQAQEDDIDILSSDLGAIKIKGAVGLSTNAVDEEVSDDAVKQLDRIIRESVQKNASDIHIEIDSNDTGLLFYRVRYRLDGRLHESFANNNLEVFSGILTQIKLRSGLKLDETRLPQDGRMNYSIFGQTHSFRVSTKPIIVIDMRKGGEVQLEKIVIRKMPDVNQLGLEKLGNTDYAVEQLKEASQLANGFNVITGPTGSGKTTLLYALLGDIDTATKNVSTIEDPVEAELKGVNQTQTLAEIGLDFARVLRAELRQDPDIIMVGEMRDKETAEIAAEASLTGHLVFSTLHTKNAVSSITRLINMGVPPFIVASALTYCVAQRLVRCLCESCKQPHTNIEMFKQKNIVPVLNKISDPVARQFFESKIANMTIYEPAHQGCEKCGGSGYKGRAAILEVFKINKEAEEIILKHNASEPMLHQCAIENGMMTLEQDGLMRVMQGVTSYSELYTVLVSD